MKITIEYDLPEEDYLYDIHKNASEYYSTLVDLQGKIRELYKYSERESIPIEELHTSFYEVLNNNNIYNL
jgi:hypothetical protein